MATARKAMQQSQSRRSIRRARLQLEALEGRLAPACTISGQTVNCDAGNDSIEVRHVVDKLQGPYQILNNGVLIGKVGSTSTITVNGGGGNNSLRVNDALFNYTNGMTYTFRTSPAPEMLIGALPVRYSGINVSLQLDAAQSSDLIWVDSTPVGPTVTVNAGNGNDVAEVAAATSNLNSLGGALSVNGNAGTDTVHVDDDGTTANYSYTVKSTIVQRASAPLIQYATAETLFVKAGSGADTITVITTKAGTTTTVKGYYGNDTISVTPAGNLNMLGGPLTVDGGADADVLTLGDQASVNNHSYTVTATSVARTGANTTTYTTMEGLTVNAGSGHNAIDVLDTQLDVPTMVNAGGGNDSVAVTRTLGDFDGIDELTVYGGSGDDSLTVWDHLTSASYDYFLDEVSLSRYGFYTNPNVDHHEIESVTLNASSASIENKFWIAGTAASVQSTVNGGNGRDYLFAGAEQFGDPCDSNRLLGALTFNGGGGVFNQASLCDYYQTTSGVYLVTPATISKLGGATVTYADAFPAVFAGNNRDLLIAGPGPRAYLHGYAGEDILIGGTTIWDANPTALNAIMAEWTRVDLSYAERVNHLLNGGGLNGGYILDPSTVHANSAQDFLYGDLHSTDAAPDLYFGEVPLDETDHDPATETFVTIGPPPIPPFSGPNYEPLSSQPSEQPNVPEPFSNSVDLPALVHHEGASASQTKPSSVKVGVHPLNPRTSAQEILVKDELRALIDA